MSYLHDPWNRRRRRRASRAEGASPRAELDRHVNSRHMVFGTSAQRTVGPSPTATGGAAFLLELVRVVALGVRFLATLPRRIRRRPRGDS